MSGSSDSGSDRNNNKSDSFLRTRGWSINSDAQSIDVGAVDVNSGSATTDADVDADADASNTTTATTSTATIISTPSKSTSSRKRSHSSKSDSDTGIDIDIDMDATPILSNKKRSRISEESRDVAKDDNVNDNNDDNDDKDNVDDKSVKFQVAKSRLSKWAARLIDPNRPRVGLVEPPKIIPLNDEFLSAFGQREREFDAHRVIPVESQIEREIKDEHDNHEDEHDNHEHENNNNNKKQKVVDKSNRRLRINNLKYTTTTITLIAACSKYGAVEDCNMLMEDDGKRNTGRAFITFQEDADAQACFDDMQELEGRPLRISWANHNNNNNSNTPNGTGNNTDNNKPTIFRSAAASTPGGPGRYFLGDSAAAVTTTTGATTTNADGTTSGSNNNNKRLSTPVMNTDLSTKCYRCGLTGHKEFQCTDLTKKIKPCPLCAAREEGHSVRNCPNKAVCYNCGTPGHISKECPHPFSSTTPQQRSLPPRSLCTKCFHIGNAFRWSHHQKDSAAAAAVVPPHTRQECHRYGPPSRRQPKSAWTANAFCMVCLPKQQQRQQQKHIGHFTCLSMKWFYGLPNLTCFNCGQTGHIGSSCPKPNLELCSRNEGIVAREIERAFTSPTPTILLNANAVHHQAQHNNNNNNNNNTRGRSAYRQPYPQQQQQQQQWRYNHSPSPPRQNHHHTRFNDNDRRRVQSMPPAHRNRGGPQQQQQQQQAPPPPPPAAAARAYQGVATALSAPRGPSGGNRNRNNSSSSGGGRRR